MQICAPREPSPDAKLALTSPDGDAKLGDNIEVKESGSVVDRPETSTVMQNDETSFFESCLPSSASRCHDYNREFKLLKVKF